MSKFKERLKILKDESGKTQATIASELGLTQQNFSYYINGREPDYDVLIRMASYFNVSVDYLIGAADVRQPENVKLYNHFGFNDSTINFLESLFKNDYELSILLGLLIANPKMKDVLTNAMLYTRPDDFIEGLASDIDSHKDEYKLNYSHVITSDFLLEAVREKAERLFGEIIHETRVRIQGVSRKKAPPKQD